MYEQKVILCQTLKSKIFNKKILSDFKHMSLPGLVDGVSLIHRGLYDTQRCIADTHQLSKSRLSILLTCVTDDDVCDG